jgi:hypothetical protein
MTCKSCDCYSTCINAIKLRDYCRALVPTKISNFETLLRLFEATLYKACPKGGE